MRTQVLLAFLFGVCLTPALVLAQSASSTNYELSQQGIGATGFDASSTNYQFKATIGESVDALASSTNYKVDIGTTWIDGLEDPTVTITYVDPEGRVGASGTNDDVVFFVTVRTSSNSDDVVLFTSDFATTSVDGTYSTQITLTDIPSGTYDIGLKGRQHLTRVLQDVPITQGVNTALNFTTSDYASTTRGLIELLGGDVNGAGTSPSTMGDDVVNSVDISTMLDVLDDIDGTGNGIRSNINQDTVVNSVDLSVMLDNLDVNGDN